MKIYFSFFFIICLFYPTQNFAIDTKSLKKYPYQLMTDDYGILNEANLKRYVDGIIPKPFQWDITGFDYWQCFSTKNVSAWYEKGEYDADEKITRGHPHLTIKNNSTEVHDYVVRRGFSLDYAKAKVEKWTWLMKYQKYVCIGGSFSGTEEKIIGGKKIKEHGWIFENLKTDKGCDSYFSGWCS
jgi:hypothetical protein